MKPELIEKLNTAFDEFVDKAHGTHPTWCFLGQEEKNEFRMLVMDSIKLGIFRVPREAVEGKYRGCQIVAVDRKSLIAFGV